MAKVLLSWIGQADLNCAVGKGQGPGPTASVLTERSFDAVLLLCTPGYAQDDVQGYLAWLRGRTASPVDLRCEEQLGDPTDYAGIYRAVIGAIETVRRQHGESVELAIHVSPGTPAMQAVWILVGSTRYPAELIQSDLRTGVRTLKLPFAISAEFLSGLASLEPGASWQGLLPPQAPGFARILRRSAVMERVVERARLAALTRFTVLIEGESGTGKEQLAHAIHESSDRARRPFIAVNCGAIPRDLIESELFGHARGAFTGATENRNGRFGDANQGTLFLDEIGELPRQAQVRLLRVLQDQQVVPVGGQPRQVDVRIVAATHRDLWSLVSKRHFREDLYYRLAVLAIHVPPLRERDGDLSLLLDHLLAEQNAALGTLLPGYRDKSLSSAARNLLLTGGWPGNVRQLQNSVARLCMWSPGEVIRAQDVRQELRELSADGSRNLLDRPLGGSLNVRTLQKDLARHYVRRAMEASGHVKDKAAKLLGLGSSTSLSNWIRTCKLESEFPIPKRRRS